MKGNCCGRLGIITTQERELYDFEIMRENWKYALGEDIMAH